MWRQVANYFGLDKHAADTDIRAVALEIAPPMVVAFLLAAIDGAHGAAGWLLLVVYIVVCRLVWIPLMRRLGIRPPRQPPKVE
jgi:hypothetical protein